jgi:hypothetical protein
MVDFDLGGKEAFQLMKLDHAPVFFLCPSKGKPQKYKSHICCCYCLTYVGREQGDQMCL